MDFDGQAITERVFKVAEAMELKDVSLAKELGVAKQNMPKFKSNTSGFPIWRVINFLKKHREINSEWILFGEGNMFGKAGKHKMTIGENGEMVFTTETPDIKAEAEEIKRLKAILEEKEQKIEMLRDTIESQKQTITNQDAYIKKLLDKL
jgi:hypothetical protein